MKINYSELNYRHKPSTTTNYYNISTNVSSQHRTATEEEAKSGTSLLPWTKVQRSLSKGGKFPG